MTDTHSLPPLDYPHIADIGFRDRIAPSYEGDPAWYLRASPYLITQN